MNAIEAHDYERRHIVRVLEERRYRTTRDERFPLLSDHFESALHSLCDECAALVIEHDATLREVDVFEEPDDEPGYLFVTLELTCGATLARVLPVLDGDSPGHPGHAHDPGKFRLCA